LPAAARVCGTDHGRQRAAVGQFEKAECALWELL
jgi:hypothetical protein